jgi:hypothetical protein
MKSAQLFKSKILSNKTHDEEFYETMFTFAGRVLQGAFERENVSKLEEEISRLFRSNAFNISARRRAEEERLDRYKELSVAPTKIEDKMPLAQRIKHTDQLIR